MRGAGWIAREERKKYVHPSSNFLYLKEIGLERKIKFP